MVIVPYQVLENMNRWKDEQYHKPVYPPIRKLWMQHIFEGYGSYFTKH